MKAALYYGKEDIRIGTVPDPEIVLPTDAIVGITHSCICGSDLWFYRGYWPHWQEGYRTGHEWMGIVEAVGAEVKTVKKGDRVLAPFAFSDGKCEACEDGVPTSCYHGGFWGGENDGGQAEAIRAPFADATLVKIPGNADNDRNLLKSLLLLTDVMGTGYHAAFSAGVRPGSVVAVVGDGAVGLCAVLSAKKLGAERIILLGSHDERIAIGRKFGATDIVKKRGEEAIDEIKSLTGHGVKYTLECVGTDVSMQTAVKITKPGGAIGYVGAPHGDNPLDLGYLFANNIRLSGGLAPVRNYIPELMNDVVNGWIDPAPVLNLEVSLDDVPQGYAAMDNREAIKVMVVND
ncbi:alcohol dehydrogenase catalytic domain-containing protein [Aquimarina sp. U1-2]|uniref:zinc-binding dehydrogenase n=1 Tax=Aquimarina sp. U1-2 TaxID=2823141 RepID=UPI001AECD828|nr:alcohol dehydrogenase catalytic domain-containing protein [Aquimarina sp. U1-2]MBP2831231.1 alcohol dehydrogenase catalytic domain-containing protein [Aquimarina sp. U1-2]